MTVPEHKQSTLLSVTKQFVGAAPRQVIIAATLALALGLTDGLTALLLLPLLDATGVDVAQGGIGRLGEYVRAAFSALHIPATLGPVLVVFVAVNALRSLLSQWRMMASVRAGQAFLIALRTRLYAAIVGANWRFVAKRRSADFAHAMTEQLARVDALTFEMLNIVVGAIVTIVYIALAMRVSAAMTSTVIAASAILFATLAPKMRRAQRDGRQIAGATSRLYAATSEHLASLKTAKSYGAERRHIESMAEISTELAGVQITATRTSAVSFFVFEVGSVVALALMVYLGLTQFRLAPGAVLMLVYLVARVMPRVATLQRGVQFCVQLLPSFDAIAALEEELHRVQEDIVPSDDMIPLRESVRFEHVRFSHSTPDESTLDDVTLELRQGAITAIVGPSGAGKSTIADILTGLLRPQEGRVSIDGTTLEDSMIAAWKRQLGYVSQDTFVFHDTVRANLSWANPRASEHDMAEALGAARAEFVFDLENGLDTVLGDRGVRLSGGERQRLALARALLRRPQLLVMDEATSALDLENETGILDAIERLRGKVTTLLITHRLSAVRRADHIYVVEGGRIVESGSWDALTSRPGSRLRIAADEPASVK
jgi:ATP-binding cassette subfamily C protein